MMSVMFILNSRIYKIMARMISQINLRQIRFFLPFLAGCHNVEFRVNVANTFAPLELCSCCAALLDLEHFAKKFFIIFTNLQKWMWIYHKNITYVFFPILQTVRHVFQAALGDIELFLDSLPIVFETGRLCLKIPAFLNTK